MDRPDALLAQIELGKGWLIAMRKRRLGAALLLQPGECEFNVLAGSQLVGRVIWAGAEVVVRLQSADSHAVVGLRLRIADQKVREEGLRAKIFQVKGLLPSELAAQSTLPVDRRKIGRNMAAGELGGVAGLAGTALGFHLDGPLSGKAALH
ncbi:MAG: hypothetical protein ACYDGU_13720 [Acidiferrobacterales bacterium]